MGANLNLSDAVARKCNVTVYEDLVAMYDLAIDTYGSVDVVVSL